MSGDALGMSRGCLQIDEPKHFQSHNEGRWMGFSFLLATDRGDHSHPRGLLGPRSCFILCPTGIWDGVTFVV